jgi:hypothetical protein
LLPYLYGYLNEVRSSRHAAQKPHDLDIARTPAFQPATKWQTQQRIDLTWLF